MAGAATCFYAFVGYDTIATSGEEAQQPSRNIPTAILVTLAICFMCYFGISAIITLMVPFSQLSSSATLPRVFGQRGIIGAEFVIAFGGLCGLTASMLGSLFPLPRLVYSMAQDGLLFRWLGLVYTKTNTPFIATWITGTVAAVLALLLDLNSLIEMMSIGTLISYSLVAVSVLLLRYQAEQVGFTEADIHEEINGSIRRETSGLSEASGARFEEEFSLPENAGFLRVGDEVKLVRYSDDKETAVFARVKPADSQQDSEITAMQVGRSLVFFSRVLY